MNNAIAHIGGTCKEDILEIPETGEPNLITLPLGSEGNMATIQMNNNVQQVAPKLG